MYIYNIYIYIYCIYINNRKTKEKKISKQISAK